MAETGDPIRQPSYRRCFVCGSENPIGLKVTFYHDAQKVWTEFTPGPEHQGYPGIAHGGIIYTLLDETIGRVAFIHNKWVLTARMQVRYRQPVAVGQKLRVEGEIVRLRGRVLEAAGRVLLPDGRVAAEASGLFMELPAQYRQELEEAVFEQPTGEGSHDH
ncbi:MAG: PaaI family thioesterase [Chloroflexota bacterium]